MKEMEKQNFKGQLNEIHNSLTVDFQTLSDQTKCQCHKECQRQCEKTGENNKNYAGILMFSTREDIPYALAGVLLMVLAALGSPFQTYVYGKVFLKLAKYLAGKYDTTSTFLQDVRVLCGAIMAIGLGRMFLTLASVFYWLMVGEKQQNRARLKLAKLIMQRDLAWFDSKKNLMGSIAQVNRCIEEIRSGVSENVAMLVLALASMVFLFINAMISLWALTLVVMASIPFMGLSTYIFGKLTYKFQKKENDLNGRASKVLDWSLVHGDLVRLLNGKYIDMVVYNRLVQLSAAEFGRMALSIAGNSTVLRILSNCIFAQGFWFGVYLMRIGKLGIDELFTSFSSCLLFGVHIASIATIVALLNKAQAAAFTIGDSHILDCKEKLKTGLSEPFQTPDCRSITLDNVSFQYLAGDKVLRNVSHLFDTTGINFIVGESGSGKSTLVLLLMSFYLPLEGSILLGGVPMHKLGEQQVFDVFTVVEPSPFVFDDSIFNNLRLNHEHVLESKLQQACSFAKLDDFLRSQPLGIHSIVCSSKLSGGQIQRIGLARAWLKNSPILILDESLNAIDSVTRREILDNIRISRQGRVTIYITHNYLEIQDTDNVLVLHKGVVKFQGLGSEYPRTEVPGLEPFISSKSIFSTKESSEFANLDYLHYPAVLRDLEENGHKDEIQNLLGLIQIVKFCFASIPSIVPLIFGLGLSIICGFASPVLSYCVSKLLSTAVSMASYHGNTQHETLKWTLIVIGIAVIDGIFYFISQSCLQLSLERWIVMLRTNSMALIDEQDMLFFLLKYLKPAELTALLMNDSRDLRVLVAEFVSSLLLLIALTLLGVIWSIVSGWKLALVGVAFVSLTMLLTIAYGIVLSHYETSYKDKVALVENFTHNVVSGIRTIRAFGISDRVEQDLLHKLNDLYSVGKRRAFFTGLGMALLELFTSVSSGTILYYGLSLVAAESYTQIQLLQVLTLLTFTLASASSLMHQLPEITRGKRAGLRFFWLSKLERLNVETSGRAKVIVKEPPLIRFRNVDFSFPDNETSSYKRVLCNMSLDIELGQKVALVGKSGSGKSTMALVLARLYEQDRGSVTYCNRSITDFDVEWYRESVVLVPQHPRFFEGSVLENMTYGMRNVSELAIWKYLEKCQISDFVKLLPKGLHTRLGEGAGTIASMGQMQILNICRGLLRDPKVLILDECTSYLDEANTRSIIDLMCNQLEMTVIFITHDDNLMRAVSRILVLNKGSIVEDGTFEQLWLHRGPFYDMIN